MSFKKIIAIVLCACFVFSLAACGKADEEVNNIELSEEFIDYSYGLDENGYYSGVNALDYVELAEDIEHIALSKEAVTVDPESVDYDMLMFEEQYGESVEYPAEHEIENGDTVNMSFSGTVDGLALPGMTAENNEITIGNGGYIEGFEESLLGHKAGDEYDLNVTFPEDYGNGYDEDGNEVPLSGKDAVFHITVHSVFTKALTDDAVKSTFELFGTTMKDGSAVDSVEKARAYFEEYERSSLIQDAVYQYILNNNTVKEIPKSVEDAAQKHEVSYAVAAAMSYQYETFEDFLKDFGYETWEEYLTGNKASLDDATKYSLILQAVAEKIGYELKDEDYALLGSEEDVATFIERYGQPYISQAALQQAIFNLLCDNAVIG